MGNDTEFKMIKRNYITERSYIAKMNIIKRLCKKSLTVLLSVAGLLVCLPILLIITGSFFDTYELQEMLFPAFYDTDGFIAWKIIPDYPTFEHFKRLFILTPQFFILFWNSLKVVVLILGGQLLVGVPAAWAFAVYSSRIGKKLFAFYVVLMLMPFQVTMLSSYLVLNDMELLNTHAAIILPAVFSTFPIFLTYGGFKEIPAELLEAARIDGAGELRIFLSLGVPLGRSGILSALVLGFLEYWNMMEQPLAFIEDKSLWPLSLYLPEISWSQAGFAFCASLVTLIPAAFVFWIGKDHLEQGILYTGLKI